MRKTLCSALALSLTTFTANANTIGVTLANLDFAFVQVLQQAYAARSDVEIIIRDAQGDGGTQMDQVQEFVDAGVDAIIVNPIQSDDGISLSMAAGEIPMVYVNQEPINSTMFPPTQAYVGSQELDAGYLQMTEVCSEMNGSGTVAILMGNLETNAARLRTEAVHEILESDACTGVTVAIEGEAKWQEDLGYEMVKGWLADGITADAYVANNDSMALGAIAALKEAGVDMDSVIVAGIDATPSALASMEAGEMDVTVFQNATGQADGSVDVAKGLIAQSHSEPFVWVPFELVTPANRTSYVQ